MLGLIHTLIDKAYVKQWNIGLSRVNFGDILKTGKLGDDFTWLPNRDNNRFFADPFICKSPDNKIQVIYEDYRYDDLYGKISVTTLDDQFNVLAQKNLLDTHSHLSYPYIWQDNGTTYIMPENSKDGEFSYYEFNHSQLRVFKKETLFKQLPLLDSTILFHDGRYWLFATHRGPHSNEYLYIYHAPHWSGPYTEHKANPVKKSLVGTRPAGSFIHYQGNIYRPTQNCGEYYGKSVIINKIIKLNEDEFEEVAVTELHPPKNSAYNFAIHTINFSDDVIVIDGLRRIFAPVDQIRTYLRKILKMFIGSNLAIQFCVMDEGLVPLMSCM